MGVGSWSVGLGEIRIRLRLVVRCRGYFRVSDGGDVAVSELAG
jgi:hypothetical protein